VPVLNALLPSRGQSRATACANIPDAMSEEHRREDTLDLPDSELRALFHGAEHLARREIDATRSGPVFESSLSAASVRALLEAEQRLPVDGEPVGVVLERCSAILAAGRRTAPTFFGYVQSPSSPVGVAADLLAAAADQNVTSWRSAPAATELELVTIRWLGQFIRFSDDAEGLLLGGGSAANLTALLWALRAQTSPGVDRRLLVVYASQEAHFSVAKAAEVLGTTFCPIAVDAARRLDVASLAETVAADRAAGRVPLCVVATAGSTTTGAVDPLGEIAVVTAEHRLWLHVDGAYGAPAASVDAQRHLFSGIEHADSVAIDAHKWLYAPLDCGALLVRRRTLGEAAASWSPNADYVRVLTDDSGEEFAFWDHGLELSRRFRALKLWMMFRHHGARRIAAAIEGDIELARYMAERVRASDELELLAEPSLSICCFRHRPPELDEGALDAHNERLLAVLQHDGAVYLSNAMLDGRFALRACITNFRTTRRDVDRTLEVVRTIGSREESRRNSVG
jgi:aromatic-L-amino-acid/L-tryptophan decarboxylase